MRWPMESGTERQETPVGRDAFGPAWKVFRDWTRLGTTIDSQADAIGGSASVEAPTWLPEWLRVVQSTTTDQST
eukprot:11764668-Karenia_brevis.AAC.1